jgi:hypothetical protein
MHMVLYNCVEWHESLKSELVPTDKNGAASEENGEWCWAVLMKTMKVKTMMRRKQRKRNSQLILPIGSSGTAETGG